MLNKNVLEIPFEKLKEDSEILERMENSVATWFKYWNDNMDAAYADANFARGKQWEAHEIADYYVRQKVQLTCNVLNVYIRNLVGEQRQNSPQIKVRPTNVKTTQAETSLIEGLLREIAYGSNSDMAYQTGFVSQLMSGYGAWRIVIDYDDSRSFNKVLRVVPIYDILKVYFDVAAQELTKTDGDYCGIYTKMSLEEFKETYKNIDPKSLNPPSSAGTTQFQWYDRDLITICEHFQRIRKKTKLYMLSNGETVTEEEKDTRLTELNKKNKDDYQRLVLLQFLASQSGQQGEQDIGQQQQQPLPPIPEFQKIKVEDERETEVSVIKHYKFIKDHILEESEFPGEDLPIIFVPGDFTWINGRQEMASFIKDAKDLQKFINFNISEIAQWLKIGHKGQFIATEQMISSYKELWRNPESASCALLYKPDPLVPNGKPDYVQPAELPVTLVQNPANLLSLTQVVLGRHEANMGAQGNEISGRAIENRAKQGNTSSFVFNDHLNKAIEQTGKICLNLLKHVYNNKRMVTIKDRDGTKNVIKINEENDNLISRNKFNIEVTIGASFEMQKMEAFNQLMILVSLNPMQFSTILADLLAQNTNLNNTNQIVERLRNFVVPPEIIAKETGQPLPQKQPDPQIQIAQTIAQARLLDAQAKITKAQQDNQVGMVRANTEMGKAHLDYKAKLADSIAKIHAAHTKMDMSSLGAARDIQKQLNEASQSLLPQQ